MTPLRDAVNLCCALRCMFRMDMTDDEAMHVAVQDTHDELLPCQVPERSNSSQEKLLSKEGGPGKWGSMGTREKFDAGNLMAEVIENSAEVLLQLSCASLCHRRHFRPFGVIAFSVALLNVYLLCNQSVLAIIGRSSSSISKVIAVHSAYTACI